MNISYEILAKKIGLSRIGRIYLSRTSRQRLNTPTIAIPLERFLMKQFSFIKEFEKHSLFIISKDIYLKAHFIREKFKNTGFIYNYNGTLEKFQEELNENLANFSQNHMLAIIPFNIPTTAVSKNFASVEIEHYIHEVELILKNYPTINFGLTLKTFDFPELFTLYIRLIREHENIILLNFQDMFNNFGKFRDILEVISQVNSKLDVNISLMASGRILPKYYPMLVYLGIDIVDSSFLIHLSSENFYDTIEYLLPIYKIQYLPCSCVACSGKLSELLENKDSPQKTDLICLHNLITAKNYMNKITQYLKTEDYRAFVEKSSLDDMNIISLLKILDRQYSELLKNGTPIIQEKKTINCLGASSYFRPDFIEFRERTIRNFEPEPWTKLILLLPCSAKKPYSQSKSHKRFYDVIRKFSDFPTFQEIILTSPLGAIPRQLEDIYPVNSYDISVTGTWDAEEKTITENMLTSLLQKYDKEIVVIGHLEGEYRDIVKRAMQSTQHEFYFSTIENGITSSESLMSLKNLIQKHKDKFKPENDDLKGGNLLKTWTRKCMKIADYQFGNGAGQKLFSNGINTKKNRQGTQIDLIDFKTKEKLAILKVEAGQLLLTMKGAKRFEPFKDNKNTVVFNGDKISGNTLFRPGIIEYDPDILPNACVFILNQDKKKVIGVGQSIVGSNYITNSKTGRVIKVYERIK